MRADMFKVIVERPRRHKGGDGAAAALRRDCDGPAFLGMRAGYDGICLNENLAPLRRYLRSQRGRPWDNVLSELRAGIDARSAVKRHILEHLRDFVATRTWLQDEQIWCGDPCGPLEELGRWGPLLYVDPCTGILRDNPWHRRGKQYYAERARREQAKVDARRRVLSEAEQLLAIDGIWYHVQVEKLPEPLPHQTRNVHSQRALDRRWDAIRCAWVSQRDGHEFRGESQLGNHYLFGSTQLYAVTKRQLGKRELRAAGLAG